MKKQIYIASILICFAIIFSSCHQVRTFSTGLPNDAYLEFVGVPGNYEGGVNVVIDETTKFLAMVKKDYAETPKGSVYAISKGTHTITVSYHGKVLFQNKIFVSPQETKKITLP